MTGTVGIYHFLFKLDSIYETIYNKINEKLS